MLSILTLELFNIFTPTGADWIESGKKYPDRIGSDPSYQKKLKQQFKFLLVHIILELGT